MFAQLRGSPVAREKRPSLPDGQPLAVGRQGLAGSQTVPAPFRAEGLTGCCCCCGSFGRVGRVLKGLFAEGLKWLPFSLSLCPPSSPPGRGSCSTRLASSHIVGDTRWRGRAPLGPRKLLVATLGQTPKGGKVGVHGKGRPGMGQPPSLTCGEGQAAAGQCCGWMGLALYCRRGCAPVCVCVLIGPRAGRAT